MSRRISGGGRSLSAEAEVKGRMYVPWTRPPASDDAGEIQVAWGRRIHGACSTPPREVCGGYLARMVQNGGRDAPR